MAKNVFRPMEITNITKTVQIDAPISEVEEVAPLESLDAPVYEGPTADDLRKEAELFKAQWEQIKSDMMAQAKAEAAKIKQEAEEMAFNEVKKKNELAQKTRQEAKEEAERIIEEAKFKAKMIEEEAIVKISKSEKEAYEKAYKDGEVKGYTEGKAEVDRLVERLHVIVTKAIEKRNEIIENAETQVINLVLLIAKKVVKVISENQKNVVINNVVQSLRKLKSRGEVAIRVNLADLKLTSEHVKDFMRMVENVKSITVLEDASVDKGGCIIETDFGQIDARISSQLHEIEERIIELMPIKTRGED